MQRKPRKLSPSSSNRSIDEILSSMENLHRRLNAGLIDTTSPAFYAVMATIIKLQLNRLSDQLDRQRIDIHTGKFQDFLIALAKVGMVGKRKWTPKRRHR
jgi:hypothetical protein